MQMQVFPIISECDLRVVLYQKSEIKQLSNAMFTNTCTQLTMLTQNFKIDSDTKLIFNLGAWINAVAITPQSTGKDEMTTNR